jgi:hypothetical protein
VTSLRARHRSQSSSLCISFVPIAAQSSLFLCSSVFLRRRRWEDNIKVDLREIGNDGANWIQLAQDRVQWRACVNTVMNLRIP